MKVLYAIQGTGNGHLSRANDIIPLLQKHSKVDILISGNQSDVKIPFKIKYNLTGLSFKVGQSGKINMWASFKNINFLLFRKEVQALPVNNYDLIINDFEPVSAWAAKLNNVPCVALSHQAAVINNKAPKPLIPNILGYFILKFYAPANQKYGFHFKMYNKNIFTPVIRNQVRKQPITDKGNITVYLPSYADEYVIKVLSELHHIKWEVFSKYTKTSYSFNNIIVAPINNSNFIKSMAASHGVLCGAGFETPAEALFMGKKLMVIPLKSQYEQACNAVALKDMGIPVLKDLSNKQQSKIENWISSKKHVQVDFPNNTEKIINQLFHDFYKRNHNIVDIKTSRFLPKGQIN